MSFAPITSPRVARDFIVYDGEWLPATMRLRLIGVYDGDRYRCYQTVREFLRSELTSKNRGKWFYAHAGGLADIEFILHEILHDHSYSVKASFSGSSAIIVHITRGHNVFHFIDSYWTLRGKLADIGTAIGMPKGDCAWDAPLPELRAYNEQDCRILWHALYYFEQFVWDLGGQLQMTLASTAMQLFRRRFLKREIVTSKSVNERLRPSYSGGRVEVIQRHAENGYYYDINSCYPHAMTVPLPGSLKRSASKIPPRRDGEIWFARCTVRIRECHLPPVPFRQKSTVYFPTGEWESWFTQDEVELIESTGHEIATVHEVMVFETFEDMREYAEILYGWRMKSDDEYERFNLKILMNALYGKTGERKEKENLIIHPTEKQFNEIKAMEEAARNASMEELREMRLPRMYRPGAFLVPMEADIPHEHIPIASTVTARARCTLFGHMEPAPVVHYCDTDGFSTNTGDLPVDPKTLGQLKLEKVFTRADFFACKFYRIDNLVRAKGFPRRTGENGKSVPFSSEDFDRVIVGGVYEFDRMPRVKEMLASVSGAPEAKRGHRSLTFKTRPKRKMLEDGTTRPWTVLELARKYRRE